MVLHSTLGRDRDQTQKRRFRLLVGLLENGVISLSELKGEYTRKERLLGDLEAVQKSELTKVVGNIEDGYVIALPSFLRSKGSSRYHLFPRLNDNTLAKKRIAEKAVNEFLDPGSNVFLSAGSTCTLIASEMVVNDKSSVNVTTNNLGVVDILAGKANSLQFLGGTIDGSWTTSKRDGELKDLENFDISFLGFEGIKNNVFYCRSDFARIQREIAQQSNSIVLVGDNSKKGKDSGEKIMSVELAKKEEIACTLITSSCGDESRVVSLA